MCLPRVSGCEVVNLESGHVREREVLGIVVHALEGVPEDVQYQG